jgi:hypothetical protein
MPGSSLPPARIGDATRPAHRAPRGLLGGGVLLLGLLVVACGAATGAPAAGSVESRREPAGAPASVPVAPPPASPENDAWRAPDTVGLVARPAPGGGATPSGSAPAAQSPQSFGPLSSVTLDVPAALRTGRFAEPRALNLPADFRISLFTARLDRPRLMAFDERGVLHVSQTVGGSVVALPDRDADGVADQVALVREGLQRPHGLAFRDGWL